MTIYDNISLIGDVINCCNFNDVPLAVVNLNQKKAFDNVDHGYLFNTMRAMGFGDAFVSYIKLLCNGAQSLVKGCGSLTAPFAFDKGIRQGCPLSGLLYSIAIEPFLNYVIISIIIIFLFPALTIMFRFRLMPTTFKLLSPPTTVLK